MRKNILHYFISNSLKAYYYILFQSQIRGMKSYIDQERRAAITIFEDKDGQLKMVSLLFFIISKIYGDLTFVSNESLKKC